MTKRWHIGIAGNCNIVSFDGDDVVGIGIVSDPEAAARIVAKYNALADEVEQLAKNGSLCAMSKCFSAEVMRGERNEARFAWAKALEAAALARPHVRMATSITSGRDFREETERRLALIDAVLADTSGKVAREERARFEEVAALLAEVRPSSPRGLEFSEAMNARWERIDTLLAALGVGRP